MTSRILAVVLLLAGSGTLRAQQPAGPWVPLGSRLDRDVRWAIDAGALRLNPHVRPFRLAAVRAAVTSAGERELPGAAARALEDVVHSLARVEDTAALLVEASLDAYRNGRRESFRAGGGRGVQPAVGVWASAATGPFVVVVNPAIEGRLTDDPEFTGAKDKEVAGRVQTAYLAASGRIGDIILGRMPRNWGSDLFDGLMLSPDAYATEQLAGSLRLGRFELTALTQRLGGVRDTTAAGVDFNRFFFAHRLDIRLGDATWLGFVESGVYGGRGQGFEPALLAPVNLGLASQFNDSVRVNSMVGAELSLPLGRGVRAEVEGFIDDIQTDKQVLTDQRPTSYGLTVAARWAPAARVHAALAYTRVSALAYRNSYDPAFEYANHHVGLGRNFSDYDQVLLRAQLRPHRDWDVTTDLAYFRQGSADFRQPFPDDSTLAQPGQGFLVAPVTSWTAGRVSVEGTPREGVTIGGQLGFTRGASGKTEAIARLTVRAGFDVLHRRMSSAWPGIER